jgi:hypothetical protein
MGRGLSPLQAWIVRQSARRSLLFYPEVLVGYFGLRPNRTQWYPGSQWFAPDAIGRRRYRSALSALSRSCRRLEERGLVECICSRCSHWAGVVITEAGRQWVDGHPDPSSGCGDGSNAGPSA